MADIQIAVIDEKDTQIALAVPGIQGPAGAISSGGSANQVFYKVSGTNYDAGWTFIGNANVDAAAAIAGTKISPNFGSQAIVTTGTNTAASFIPTSATIPSNGIYLPGANQVGVATNGTRRLLIDSAGALTLDTGDATIYGVRVGRGASAISTNTVVGNDALTAITTGGLNTAMGGNALKANTDGIQNTAVGYNALITNTSGSYNTAYGLNALFNNTTGSNNTCIGNPAGTSLTTGSNNTIIGCAVGAAGLADTVIIAAGATERLRITSTNTLNFVGAGTAGSTQTVSLSGSAPVNSLVLDSSGRLGIGNSSPGSFNSFANNLVVGTGTGTNGITIYAGNASTSALNFADGTSGNDLYPGYIMYNHANDSLSFIVNYAGSATARMFISSAGNVGIGSTSPSYPLDVKLTNDTYILAREASNNITTGFRIAGPNNESAAIFSSNSATGEVRLGGINTNYFQTFYTNNSEKARIDTSGRLLIGTTSHTGANLLQVNSDALINGHTVGRGAGAIDTNVAIGDSALSANTNGLQNVAIGVSAMSSNTGGDFNTAVGLQAGRLNTVSDNNTAIGYQTIYGNSGAENTAIGSGAGYAGASGAANSTGTNNTFVGYYAVGASATASNTITLGNSSITTLRCATATITTISDARDKTNIIDIPAGLDFIQALHPVAFDWDTRDKAKVGIHEFGFIAQELQIAQENTGIVVPNLVSEANPEKLEVAISTLLPVLVKAIQEQQAIITDLLARVTALEAQ